MIDVMIIDDEEEIVNGLSHIVDWDKLGFRIVYSTTDAMKALAAIDRHQPGVVVTDIRMPGINGLDLIARIKKYTPDIQVLIISGYGDFSYAKEAIELGVSRYLLKPVDEDELIDALMEIRKKAVRTEYSEKRDDLINQLLLNDLIKGISLSQEKMKKLSILDQFAPFQLLMLSYHESQINAKSDCMAVMANTIVKGIENYYSFKEDDCLYLLLMGKIFEKRSIKLRLEQDGEDYIINTSVRINISGKFSRLSSVPNWTQILRERLRYQVFFHETDSIIDCCDVNWHRRDEVIQNQITKQSIERIKGAISYFRFKEIEQIFSDLKDEFIRQKAVLRPDDVRTICLDLMNYLQNTLKNEWFEKPDRIRLISSTLLQIQTTQTVDQVVEQCIQVFREMIREMVGSLETDSNIINVIQYYIQLNLHEPLSLEQVAQVFHFNASYLSTLFARETKETFSRYVMNLRLKKSAQLLESSSISIHAICAATGFNSEKTFYKQFKNYFKCTPNEYRSRSQNASVPV